jgi:dTDP-4-amino-4,6-dideoxygalactose transaminase
MQPAMRPWAPTQDLPGTRQAAAMNLALPMGPTLGPEAASQVVAALRATRSDGA